MGQSASFWPAHGGLAEGLPRFSESHSVQFRNSLKRTIRIAVLAVLDDLKPQLALTEYSFASTLSSRHSTTLPAITDADRGPNGLTVE